MPHPWLDPMSDLVDNFKPTWRHNECQKPPPPSQNIIPQPFVRSQAADEGHMDLKTLHWKEETVMQEITDEAKLHVEV